jgi:cytoskeletal protein CcmA (bactofilin family)
MFTRKPDRSEARPATVGSADQDKKSDTPDTPSPTPLKLSTPLKELSQMAPSVIGEDLTVEGNVISKGEVQLEGEIKGDCHCISLVIGDKALIEGGVVAQDVIVRGRVVGSVRGHRVTLQSSSHVEGDIFHQSLAIEQGAFFEGKSRRSDDPIADAKTSLSSSKSDFGSGSSSNSSCSSGSASSDSSSSSESTRAAE